MNGRIKRETAPARLTIIGKVKTGIKNDKGLPQSVDHFIFESNYANKLKEIYGEKPTKIEIIFPGDDFRDVCDERYELRTSKAFDGVGGRLFASGDGEEFRIYDKEKDDYQIVTIPPDSKDKFMEETAKTVKGEWVTSLTLRFIIMKLTGVFGIFQYTTKGEASTIPQVVSVLDAVYERAGRISGIPFDLEVEIAKSQKPGSQSKFPVVKLIPNLSADMLEQIKTLEADRFTPLTVERIHHLAGSQALLPEKTAAEAVSETFEISPELPKGVISDGLDSLESCGSKQALDLEAQSLLKKYIWDADGKKMLRDCYDRIVTERKWTK